MKEEITRTCARPGCNTEFVVHNSKKRYCSNTCRAKHSIEKNVLSANADTVAGQGEYSPPVVAKNFYPDLSASANYIIKHLEGEVSRWEKQYDQKVKEVNKLTEEKENLKTELQELKTTQRIKEVEKPSGLNGLLSSPMVAELMPHLGPVLGKLLENLVTPKTATPQLQGQQSEQTASIIKWLSTLPATSMQNFETLVIQLSSIQDPNNFNYTVTRLINLLSNGTTATTTQGGAMSAASAAY